MKQIDSNDPTKKYKRKKKKKIKKRTLLLLIIMIGYLIYHYVYLEIQYQQLVRSKEKISMEIQETQNYQEQLLGEMEKAKSDKYIENLARKYFGLVYPNEKVYIERQIENTDRKE